MLKRTRNAFEKRQALRAEKRRERSACEKASRLAQVNHICEMYENAYFMWAGQHVHVRYVNGWYYVGGNPMHEQQIMEKVNRMLAAVHSEEIQLDDVGE